MKKNFRQIKLINQLLNSKNGKNVVFTEFMLKMCESKFLYFPLCAIKNFFVAAIDFTEKCWIFPQMASVLNLKQCISRENAVELEVYFTEEKIKL